MRSVNKVILIGNLTRDPEMRQTPNGQSVATFGIATNREWVTRDGRKQTSAEFHDVVAWAKLADICKQYLRKGKLVYIEGYLKTRSWDTPEGVKKFKTEIVVQDMIMLDKKSAGESEDFIPEADTQAQFSSEEPAMEMTETHERTQRKPTPSAPTIEEQKTAAAVNIDDDLGL